jgi:hypothetical protein
MRTNKQKKVWKKWYEENKVRILKLKSEWQKKNRQKVNEYQKEWHNRQENIGKSYEYFKKCIKGKK